MFVCIRCSSIIVCLVNGRVFIYSYIRKATIRYWCRDLTRATRMDLAKLKAIQSGNKSAITRLFRKIDELNPETDVNESIQRIINAIAEKQRVLTDINDRILEETSVEDIENEITDTDEYMFDLQTKVRTRQIIRYRATVTLRRPQSDVSKLINTNVQTTADNQNLNQNQTQQETIFQQASNFEIPPVTSNTANHSHRLPKLDLPKFGGN